MERFVEYQRGTVRFGSVPLQARGRESKGSRPLIKMQQLNNILQRGCWHSKDDCPSSPRKGAHRFEEISRQGSESHVDVLITSRCVYCVGVILDCPTISLRDV